MDNHSVKERSGRQVHTLGFSLSDLKQRLKDKRITNYSASVLSEAMRKSSITEAVNHVMDNS
jgi:hypothetical protein